MDSWDEPIDEEIDEVSIALHDTADPSPHAQKPRIVSSPASVSSEHLPQGAKRRNTKQVFVDDDTEHFRQYVSSHKNPTGAAFLRRRTLQQRYISPANRGQKTGATSSMRAPMRRAGPTANGMPPPSPSNQNRSPTRFQPANAAPNEAANPYAAPKPQWNDRLAVTEHKIPSYDATSDRHLRRHRRMMQKKSKLSSAYKTTPPPNRAVSNGRRSIRSNYSTHSPTALQHSGGARRAVQRNGWVGGAAPQHTKENLDPNSLLQSASPTNSLAQKTIQQLQNRLDDSTRLLETKENDLKLLRQEKVQKDRLVEKIKDRYRKLKEHGAALKEENDRLQDKLKKLSSTIKSRKKSTSSASSLSSTGGGSGTAKQSLQDTLNKHRQQVTQLQNELNMFKTQNQMLRAQEKEAREGNQNQDDYVEEITRLRKQLRVEKERVRKLKERVDDNDKSTQRVDKLRTYLEREKKDASKTQALNQKLQQQFDELQMQYNSSLSKIEDMDREKKELALKLQQLKEVILAQKKRIETLETDNIDLGQKIINIEKNTSGVVQAKSAVQQQVIEKEEDLKRMARRVTQLEKEKTDVELQHSTLRNEFEAIKTKYQQMEAKMRALKSTQQSVSATSAENDKLQSENDKLQTEKDMLQSEKNKLQSECSKLHSENERLKGDLKQLRENQNSKLENERVSKEQTAKELDVVQKELKQLREEVKSLRMDQSRKDQLVSTMQSEKSALEQQLDKERAAVAEVDDLRQKLQEATDRCSVLSESNSLLLLRLKREEAKRDKTK